MRNKLKFGSILLSVMFALSLVFATGCGKMPEDVIDETKSQLYIGVWDGGYKANWVDTWGRKFEELYKDYSFEEGKTGVQVHTNLSKVYYSDVLAYKLIDQIDEICFVEQENYYILKNANALYDVTEWVTSPLTEYGENKSIKDKMNEMDVSYYGQSETSPQFYAIPWYYATAPISYDVKLFEDNNFFFAADGYGDSNGFVTSESDPKSNGPDGVSGTIDDGLPATYDDFFKLCDNIVDNGCVPVIWAGSVQSYVNNLLLALVADFEGYESMKLNYTFDGTVSSLVKTIESGVAKLEQNPTTINEANGYLLKKQQGWYEALKFLHKLITTEDEDGNLKYLDEACFSQTSHTSAQTKFLRSNYDNRVKPIAMLVDGTWWYNEARDTFGSMSSISGCSQKDRKIGVMTMPKASADRKGEATFITTWISSVVVRSNIEESKKALIREFFRFIHTDENLSSYMVDSCGIRPYTFELKGISESDLPMFTRQQYYYYKTAKSVMPYSNNSICRKYLNEIHNNFTSLIGNSQETLVTSAFRNGYTAEEYFNGMSAYMDSARWSTFLRGV